MLRRRQEELDDLLEAINAECDSPRRFYLARQRLWCQPADGPKSHTSVSPDSLTKNQLYDFLYAFLAGIAAGKRYGIDTSTPKGTPCMT